MSHSPRTRHLSVVTVVVALLLPVAAGCGSDTESDTDEPPAVCSSVEALEASVATVTTVDLDQGALTELRDNLSQVESDLRTVVADAGDEYAAEINALDEAVGTVGSSLRAAITSPSSQALTDIGASVEQLSTSVSSLQEAVASTC